MGSGLQATASFAGEVCNQEIQAPLPAYNVGDRVCDLAEVPTGADPTVRALNDAQGLAVVEVTTVVW